MILFDTDSEIVKLFLSANRVALSEIRYSEYSTKRDMYIYKTKYRTYRILGSAIDYLQRKEVAR